MRRLGVHESTYQDGSLQDDSCPRTTLPASAVRTPAARATVSAAAATSRSVTASPGQTTGCSTAALARPASPSSKAPRSSTPSCRTTRSSRSWSTWPKGAASVRPRGWWESTRTRSRDWLCSRASTPRPPTTSWWLFPPQTREVQLDEKWAFVSKKQKNCDPTNRDDDHCGDYWDHVGLDPEHKLILAVIPGARTQENARAIVTEVKRRVNYTSDDGELP